MEGRKEKEMKGKVKKGRKRNQSYRIESPKLQMPCDVMLKLRSR